MKKKNNLFIPIHQDIIDEEKKPTILFARFLQSLVDAIRGRMRWVGAWSSEVTYSKHDVTSKDSWVYVAKISTKEIPSSSSTDWEVLSSP